MKKGHGGDRRQCKTMQGNVTETETCYQCEQPIVDRIVGCLLVTAAEMSRSSVSRRYMWQGAEVE